MQENQGLWLSLALLSSLMVNHTAFAEDSNSKKSAETHGEAIFSSICAHCHNTTYDESSIGAPGLQGVLERHNEAWLNEWIKGPETFAKKDVAARDLIESNKFGLAMPTLPAMQDDRNRAAIIEYLKTLK